MKTTTMSSSTSSTISIPTQSSNYEDEMFMNKNLLFSDSVKDLRNLRSQLYSAAEYFEAAYPNDKQKPILVSNLKDYTIKALVNTVDHLGSLTNRVNLLVDEKVDEVWATKLRVSCIEQRLRTCQAYIDHEGFAQQSLAIATPKHHKRYILPVGESVFSAGHTISAYQGSRLGDEDNWDKLKNAVRTTFRNAPSSSLGNVYTPIPTKPTHQGQAQEDEENSKKLNNFAVKNPKPSLVRSTRSPSPTRKTPQPPGHNHEKLNNVVRGTLKTQPSSAGKGRSPSPTLLSMQHGLFSFRDKQKVSDKEPDSPRSKFPLLRSGSTSARSSPKILSRSTTPIPTRSITPILSRSTTTKIPSGNTSKRCPSEPPKSFITRAYADTDHQKASADKDNHRDIEQHQSKSKRILKNLLSRRKSKKADLYTFLDEY
ncbi:protein ABIL2-like [Papaver somniferum]|uniref:protein ABIL2-like n=1 Tax=Papaver somniferum TaxID=3469 RepID=UPI000E702476|nr:protein ABIL2-like [Papaver somniferum]XP_026460842.1 protein ABIL2-like [Papaver somniferum]XP_026460843.1 protein ABIL2-like [Papaver somniferum]XP_026460844.1 protein ABIL2-like [Papaver somniferum]XP_026460845.1 protein ABIL2-like [Papaver somniferum]